MSQVNTLPNIPSAFYPYSQVPYPSYQTFPAQPLWPSYYPVSSNQRIDIILIAILVLVSLDMIFVRPTKK